MEGCRGLEKESAGWASSGGRPADAKMEPSGWAASGGIPADAKTSGGRKKRPADAKMSGGRKIVRPADAKTSGGRRNARPADVRRTQKRPADAKTLVRRTHIPADANFSGRKIRRTESTGLNADIRWKSGGDPPGAGSECCWATCVESMERSNGSI